MSLASLCVSFFATSEIYFHSSHNYLAVQLAHEEEDEDGLGKREKTSHNCVVSSRHSQCSLSSQLEDRARTRNVKEIP